MLGVEPEGSCIKPVLAPSALSLASVMFPDKNTLGPALCTSDSGGCPGTLEALL